MEMLMLIGATGDITNFCSTSASIFQLIGYVVLIFKIVIPLLLIVFGMIDLGRAVISSDDKAISNAVGKLVRRFIAAIVIFFIPTIVNLIFSAAVSMDLTNGDYKNCFVCVTDVNSCVVSETVKVGVD